MGNRRKARESALQILFQLEFDDTEPPLIQEQFWASRRAHPEVKEYCREIVEGVLLAKEDIDRQIQSVSAHWRLSRMALVDRNILRIAVFELNSFLDLAPAVVINEAVEITKKYSSEKAGQFVNGILDALSKSMIRPDRPEKDSND